MQQIQCPSCKAWFYVPEDSVGCDVRCPECNSIIRVVTEASQNPKTSGFAITSLVLGILSLVVCFVGCVLAIPGLIFGLLGISKINHSNGAITGKGLAIGGIITSVLSLLFCIPISAAMVLSSVSKARGEAAAVMCMNNMKTIGMAIITYANDHNGTLPNSLDDIKSYVERKTVFDCPSDLSGDKCYILLTNYKSLNKIKSPSTTPLVIESHFRHGDSMNIVFADAAVVRLSRDEARELFQKFNIPMPDE